jgi:hypothetical protein
MTVTLPLSALLRPLNERTNQRSRPRRPVTPTLTAMLINLAVWDR